MPKFVYFARSKISRNDSPKSTVQKGIVEAVDEKQAAKILRQRGFVPIKISLSSPNFFQNLVLRFFKKISLTDVANFTRNIATMITAGLPLTEALAILKNQMSSKMIPVVEDILTSIEAGASFSEALARHPNVFSKVYIALVKAGESAGVLDVVMNRLADNLETQKEFQAKVKGAMIYPIIVITGMGGVALIMMIFVIPKLTGLYKEFGAKLPGPTQALISISNFLSSNLLGLIFLFLGAFYFFRLFQKTPVGRKKIDRLKLKIPLYGDLQKKIVLAELSRTLGLLVGAGVQIVEALTIVADASTNIIFVEGMKRAAKRVEKGFPLSHALAENEDFPPIMSQLLSVGEETGKMDEVMGKISRFFETEADQTLKGLTAAIEPLIMILLGVGVGFLIIAIILPIYNLTSQF